MKIIVFLAEGFEEVEALTVVDYLRRVTGITVETVAIGSSLEVLGAHHIQVKADKQINDLAEIELYDGIVIPGGMPGASNLRDHKAVITLIQAMHSLNKLVASICAGPIVLEKAGIINGKNITSYPGLEKELPHSIYKEDSVVRDGNIITSRGPGKAGDFALEIVNYLVGEKEANNLKKNILY